MHQILGKAIMPSDLTSESPEHRQCLLEKVFKFDVDFPDEIAQIQQLLKRHALVDCSDEVLRYELGQIVYRIRRYRDPGYAKNISDLEEHTAAAAIALGKAAANFARLDSLHKETFGDAIAGFASYGIDAFSSANAGLQLYQEIIFELEKMSRKAQLVAFSVKGIRAFESKQAGRSRPKLPYLMPTLRFIELWEALTGAKVVAPKGVAKDHGKDGKGAIQPSTEFIRLALKMIDPKITAANAITSIKNALAANKETKRLLSDRRGSCPEILLEIMKEIRASKKSKDPA
jgi:hypothetical protein